MTAPSHLDQGILAILDAHRRAPMLRVITCGSVDDGKSTLIGRLLYESHSLFADQMELLAADSERFGTQGGGLDFALLVDGLSAEREQGITIDVAYRFLATPHRRIILADTPGHEQYTRNMVTGASTADVAMILVDVRKGVLPQTRRHALLAHLVGVRQIVLAVNKLDLVGYDEAAFRKLTAEFQVYARHIGIDRVTAIPISGLMGDNICASSSNMRWYEGPTLIEFLDAVPLDDRAGDLRPFRLPVQWVNRPDPTFRGFSGLVASGTLKTGDAVLVMPSRRPANIARIVTLDGDLTQAGAGTSITVTLDQDIDCARGDVIAAAGMPPDVADQFEATIVWLGEDAMLPGRSYWLKISTQTVTATVTALKHEIDVDTAERLATKTLSLNEIGVANIATDRPIVYEPYAEGRALGGFILIDRLTNATVGAGLIHFALRRSANVHWQAVDVSREERAMAKRQRPRVLWFTGISAAGKSTIANLVERRLAEIGRHTFLLDGDNIRHGLNRDLGFTDADRVENIRRIGEVAKLMTDAGLIVLAAFISPFRAERAMVREMMPEGAFIEIHVDVPLAIAEQRDPKALYAKARRGEIENFTGIDSPYEPPVDCEILIDTTATSAEESADQVVDWLLALECRAS